VQVVHHQGQGRGPRQPGQHALQGVEQAVLVGGGRRAGGEFGQQQGQLGGGGEKFGQGRIGRRRGPQQVNQRTIGTGAVGLQALAAQEGEAQARRVRGGFGGQARLADAGLAGEQDELALAAGGALQPAREGGQRLGAADEGGADDGFIEQDSPGVSSSNPRLTVGLILKMIPFNGVRAAAL